MSAVFTYRRSQGDYRRQISHDYLTTSNRLLEQAFDEMDRARSERWNGLPKPDRLLWLTVARRILESRETAEKITEDSHIILSNQARNFWRGKLYDLLRPLGTAPLTYFAEDADSILISSGSQRSCISHKSLRVVIDFLKWPENMPDPLKDTKGYDEADIERLQLFEYRAVGDFLEAQNVMISGSHERKEYVRKKWRDA